MTFQNFLDHFVPPLQAKAKQVNLATWILETTGSEDAAALKASLEVEFRLFFNDRKTYQKLLDWDRDRSIQDPLLKRQLNVLIRSFKPNLIDKDLMLQIAEEEAKISLCYANFRPLLDGKAVSENDIRDILKHETDPSKRKQGWEASKEIGARLAPHILKIVDLRNRAAKTLGYSNYFSMQLALQEVDENKLFATLEAIGADSENAYRTTLQEINSTLAGRFSVSESEIGPWAWSEPFCQEDPLDSSELDQIVLGIDMIETAKEFYHRMGLDVAAILEKSDQWERPGKNQHAFCISIDREKDIRTLNNLKPTIKWLETLLHELGHAVYDQGCLSDIPWLLREPPHMITTEAMALLAGRQAYRKTSLNFLAPKSALELKEKAEKSLQRRQLIFSRWVLVMTYFERELYQDPSQDLNTLWWKLVKRFQKIECKGSLSHQDWAAKYHISLAPAYYFSYLLGELFASMLEEKIPLFASAKTGTDLQNKLFAQGNSQCWSDQIKQATGEALNAEAWLRQFCK